MSTGTIDRMVRAARRKLVVQDFLNCFVLCVGVALAISLIYMMTQPFALPAAKESIRWWLLGSLCTVGTIAAFYWTYRRAPSSNTVALEIDSRFGLRERVCTVVALPEQLKATSAGQAVLADTEAQVANVRISDQFTVRPRWNAVSVPVLIAAIVAVSFWWSPEALGVTVNEDEKEGKNPDGTVAKTNELEKKKGQTAKPPVVQQPQRPNKSDKLKDLEEEIAKLNGKYQDKYDNTPDKQREKATELVPLEEKARKFAQEQEQKMDQMASKFAELDKLKKDKDFDNKNDPASKFQDALSKGDFKKAEDEIDELKKKSKDKNKDPEEQKKLEKQLDKIKNELERLKRDKEEEKKKDEEKKDELKKDIEEKKKKGENAEQLERELEKLEDKAKQQKDKDAMKPEGDMDGVEELAQRLGRAKEAIQNGDPEEIEKALESVKSQLQKLEGDVEDFKEAEEQLQRLREERRAAAQSGKGEKGEKGGEPGDGQGGDPTGQRVQGQGVGQGNDPSSGKRPINEDAKTSSVDERVRSQVDKKGKMTFGGTTRGPAFTKKTEIELGKDIQQAVQEAPGTTNDQRLPRDSRDAVREYFEKLGGTGKK